MRMISVPTGGSYQRSVTPSIESGLQTSEDAVRAPTLVRQPAPIMLVLRGCALVANGHAVQSIAAGLPFTARLALDLVGPALEIQEVEYCAAIYARQLCGRCQILREVRGIGRVGESALIEAQGIALSPGIYRISAHVAICRPGGRCEGANVGMILVYEGRQQPMVWTATPV